MITNPEKGDVSFAVGEKTFTLRYNHLALVKLETTLNRGLVQVIGEISSPEKMRLATMIALLWAGLQKHHPGMSQEDAAEILDELGGIGPVMPHIDEAFGKAFAATSGTKGTNPPQQTTNGSGMISSSNMSVSDMIPNVSGQSLRKN
jgi:hypothetical protein